LTLVNFAKEAWVFEYRTIDLINVDCNAATSWSPGLNLFHVSIPDGMPYFNAIFKWLSSNVRHKRSGTTVVDSHRVACFIQPVTAEWCESSSHFHYQWDSTKYRLV